MFEEAGFQVVSEHSVTIRGVGLQIYKMELWKDRLDGPVSANTS